MADFLFPLETPTARQLLRSVRDREGVDREGEDFGTEIILPPKTEERDTQPPGLPFPVAKAEPVGTPSRVIEQLPPIEDVLSRLPEEGISEEVFDGLVAAGILDSGATIQQRRELGESQRRFKEQVEGGGNVARVIRQYRMDFKISKEIGNPPPVLPLGYRELSPGFIQWEGYLNTVMEIPDVFAESVLETVAQVPKVFQGDFGDIELPGVIRRFGERPVEGPAVSIFGGGFIPAVEQFRARSMLIQIGLGLIFDPLVIFKALSISTRLIRAGGPALKAAIRVEIAQAAGLGASKDAIDDATNEIMRRIGTGPYEIPEDLVTRRALTQAAAGGPPPPGRPPISGAAASPDDFTIPVLRPGSLETVRNTWAKDPTATIRERVSNFRRVVEEKLTDKFSGINAMTRRARRQFELETGSKLPDSMDGELHAALLGGGPQAGVERARETIIAVEKALGGVSADHVDEYMRARHAFDIMIMRGTVDEEGLRVPAKGRKLAGGIDGIEGAESVTQELAREIGQEKFRKVLAASALVRNHYQEILDRMVDSGLVSRELADELKDKYPWYNPIEYERSLIEYMDGVPGSRSISVTHNDLRWLSDIGSEAAQQRPLDILPRYTVQSEMLIRRNDAARATILSAQFDPHLRDLVTREITEEFELPARGTAPVAGPPARIQPALTGPGRTPELPGPVTTRETTATVTRTTTEAVSEVRRFKGSVLPMEKRGTISFLENGKRQVWIVPGWMENEAKHLANLGITDLERLGSFANSIPRAILTQYNPAFFAANFVFDSMSIMTTRGVLPHEILASLVHSLKDIVSNDETIRQMIKAGGSVGGFTGRTAEQVAADVARKGQLAIRTPNDWKNILAKPFQTINRIGQAVEIAPRRAVFRQQLRKGETVQKAALESRRATVDFQRSGTAVRMANSLFLYLNAGVQGALLPIRALRDIPAARKGLSILALSGMAAYSWNRQFPEYQDVPLFDKYGKFIIMLPSNEFDQRGNKVPHYIAVIPMMREFALFTAPLTYTLERLDGRNQAGVGEFLRGIFPQLNPASAFLPSTGGGIPVPTYFGETMTEILLNKDTFRNRPVVPPELEGLPAKDQFDESSSEASRRLGQFLNVSPKRIDHIMRSGMGWDIMASADAVLRKFSEGEDPRIESLAAQLESIQETFSPEVIAIERRKFLNSLTPEDRKAVLSAQRTPDPRTPFVDSLTRRFYRKMGGQIYETGTKIAAKESGVSKDQTRKAGRTLATISESLHSNQQQRDSDLENKVISHSQWREGRSNDGTLYQGALLSLADVFPQAAQVQSVDEWYEFQRLVATLGESTPDRRTRAQILVAGWRAIRMEETSPGVPNMGPFYDKRDLYKESLSGPDLDLLEESLSISQTPKEQEFERDQEILREYWESPVDYIKENKLPPKRSEIWAEYRAMPSGRAKALFRVQHEVTIDYADGLLADLRNIIQEDPEIDSLLVKWEYDTSPETLAGLKTFMELEGAGAR